MQKRMVCFFVIISIVVAYSFIYSQDKQKHLLSEKDIDVAMGEKVEQNQGAEKELKELFSKFVKEKEEWQQKEEEIPIENVIEYFGKLKTFSQKYPNSSSDLTAKLITIDLCIKYTLAEERERGQLHRKCKKLLEDIIKSYKELWQGRYAIYLLSTYYYWDGSLSEKERYEKALELFEKNEEVFKNLDDEKGVEFRMLFDDDIGRRSENISGDVLLGRAAIHKLLGNVERCKEILKKIKDSYKGNPKIQLSATQLLDTIEYEEALKKKEKEDRGKK